MSTQAPLPIQDLVRGSSEALDRIRATRGFHWWYPAIIDRMIAHPEWTKQQIARDLGVSDSTIYLVTSCDLFRAHLARRREEISRSHDHAIGERLAKCATLALDKMVEHLDSKPGASLSLSALTELSDKVLSRLGYGENPRSGGAAAVSVNVHQGPVQQTRVVVSAEDLREARSALRASEQAKLIESEPHNLLGVGVGEAQGEPPELQERRAAPPVDLPCPPVSAVDGSAKPASPEGEGGAESPRPPGCEQKKRSEASITLEML